MDDLLLSVKLRVVLVRLIDCNSLLNPLLFDLSLIEPDIPSEVQKISLKKEISYNCFLVKRFY
jgi:hypothetical protein